MHCLLLPTTKCGSIVFVYVCPEKKIRGGGGGGGGGSETIFRGGQIAPSPPLKKKPMCVCPHNIISFMLFHRELDCGNHLCERPCHAGSCFSCCLLPANITHCPCGAETVDSLLQGEGSPRTSCLDPVPTCNNICGKTLPCSTAGI